MELRYDWDQFSSEEQDALLSASRIYFPTIHYYSIFNCLGIDIFPSTACYELLGDKIRQTLLFKALDVPHPRTRLFVGKDRDEKILAEFDFPFVAKMPRGGWSRGHGVFLIRDMNMLRSYLESTDDAYIQEYIQTDRDLRVVIIGADVVLAYWKISNGDDFRTNVARGGRICFDHIPEEALELCLHIARSAGIDHAGFDVIMTRRGPSVIEANIHFGREGFRERGINYKQLLAQLADSGRI